MKVPVNVKFTYPANGQGRAEVSDGNKTVHFPWFAATPADEKDYEWYLVPDDGVLVCRYTDPDTGETDDQVLRW